jgi:hypothetical protein
VVVENSIETLLLSSSRSTTYTMKYLLSILLLSLTATMAVAVVTPPMATMKSDLLFAGTNQRVGQWQVQLSYRCQHCDLQLVRVDANSVETVLHHVTESGHHTLSFTATSLVLSSPA